MPMYEYKCHKCGSVFEKRQSFSDSPLTKHEECGGEVERLISPPAFQFKGSGWYITDYAKNGSSGAAGKSNGTSSESNGTESKPAAPASTSSSTESTPAKSS